MNPDYEGLVGELKRRDAIPLVLVYGVQEGDKVKLDFLTTPAYDDSDSVLKGDIKSAVEKVVTSL